MFYGEGAFRRGIDSTMVGMLDAAPEIRLTPEPPPLLKDVGVVYAATHNENKLAAVRDWVDSFGIVRGEGPLQTLPKIVPGNEPDWTDALLVAANKTDELVRVLKGEPGPNALVVGSDVVVWMNGHPKHNLSRIEELTGKHLADEVLRLQEMFSEPSVVMWDVATAVRRKGVQAATGDRIIVAFEPIESHLVAEIFAEDIPGALGRNTRLPLIDDPRLNRHIIGGQRIPLRDLVGSGANLSDWHYAFTAINPESLADSPISVYQLSEFKQEIVGGIPVNGTLGRLAQFSAERTNGQLVVV